MEYLWSLKELYPSFDSKEFKGDMVALDAYIQEYKTWVDSITVNYSDVVKKLEDYIEIESRGAKLISKLYDFAELTLSVDTKNKQALKSSEILQTKFAATAEHKAKLNRWIGGVPDIEKLIESSSLLSEHQFHLMELVEQSKYLLSNAEEAVIAKMRNTGSNAWTKLKDLVTSTLKVDIELEGEKKQLPLSVIKYGL